MEVPKVGDYAVNISYIAAKELDMNVRINNGKEKIFNFVASGRWCFEGNTHPDGNGEPTVVAMELQGFKVGTNTIHLSRGTTRQAPVIDWIAVVPKDAHSISSYPSAMPSSTPSISAHPSIQPSRSFPPSTPLLKKGLNIGHFVQEVTIFLYKSPFI